MPSLPLALYTVSAEFHVGIIVQKKTQGVDLGLFVGCARAHDECALIVAGFQAL